MSAVRFKRFTKPSFLKEIGRDLLGRFFDKFKDDISAKGVEMPGGALADDPYFERVARVAMAPDGLPDDLIEAIYAIEAMANADGQERLENAVARSGAQLAFNE